MLHHCRVSFLLLFLAMSATVEASEVLLSMPEPPEGYAVSKFPLELEGKIVGYHVQVISEDVFSKVVVQIETASDRTSHEQRVAGLKGYVNGLANGLKDAGFKLTDNTVPNVKTANLDELQTIEMQFADDQSGKLFVRQFIFFTDKGYNVQVLAMDEEELDRLTRWARHIRAAEALE